MIEPINIDITDLVKEFNLSSTQAEELSILLVNQITDRIFYNWQSQAKNNLHSTRNEYIRNLNIQHISATRKAIILTGKIPNMIEEGASAYDMKPGFLGSSKAKTDKNGRKYLIIPFRHATPNAIGESQIFANVMPQDVYKVVKTLAPTKTDLNNGIIERGGRLDIQDIPQQYQAPRVRPAFSDINKTTTFPSYTHKSSIYEGMIRNEKTYENATQSSYVTFRRVSENSDIMSWIHKGFQAQHFAKKAVNQTDVVKLSDRTIDSYLQQIL